MTDEEFPPPAEEARPRPASQQSNDLPDARREQDTFLSEPALRERGRAVVVQPSPSARDRPETVASQGVSQTVGVSSPAGPIRIALWGAPGSGKTTFLAALMLAVSTGSRAIGQWTMYPVNAASEEFLVRSVHQLVVEQRFPEATPLSVITPISVILKGDLTGSEFAPRRRFWKRGPVIDSFQLDLLDLAGEAFAYDPERQIPSDTADAAIDNIADAQGLVYFFDPVSEFDRRSSAEYMYSPLVRLLGRMKGQASDSSCHSRYLSV